METLEAQGGLKLGYDALSANGPSLSLCLSSCLPESLFGSSSSSDLPGPGCVQHTGGLQGSAHKQTHYYIITWQLNAETKLKGAEENMAQEPQAI